MARKIIPDAVFAKAKAMLDAGTPMAQVAREMGVSATTLWRVLGPVSKTSRGRPAADATKLAKAREMLLKGSSYKEAAEASGISLSSLYRAARPHDIGRRPTPAKTRMQQQRDEIAQLLNYGHSYQEISEMLGISPSTIYSYLPRGAGGATGDHERQYWGFLAAAFLFDAREAANAKGLTGDDVIAYVLDVDRETLVIDMRNSPSAHVLRPGNEDVLARVRDFLRPLLRPAHLRPR